MVNLQWSLLRMSTLDSALLSMPMTNFDEYVFTFNTTQTKNVKITHAL